GSAPDGVGLGAADPPARSPTASGGSFPSPCASTRAGARIRSPWSTAPRTVDTLRVSPTSRSWTTWTAMRGAYPSNSSAPSCTTGRVRPCSPYTFISSRWRTSGTRASTRPGAPCAPRGRRCAVREPRHRRRREAGWSLGKGAGELSGGHLVPGAAVPVPGARIDAVIEEKPDHAVPRGLGVEPLRGVARVPGDSGAVQRRPAVQVRYVDRGPRGERQLQ